MKRSQLGINSISVRGEFIDMIDGFAAAGFPNVEFFLGHVKGYLEQGHKLADVARLLDERKLQCIGGFQAPVVCFGDAAAKKENHQLLVDNARLLGELGATGMVVGTDGPADLSKVKDPLGVIAKSMAQIAKRIKKTGVTLCMEFNWSPLLKTLPAAAEVSRRAGDGVGVLFDPAHYHCTATKMEDLTAANVAEIAHVHVDDMAPIPAELSNCNADRRLPLEGCLDIRQMFKTIEKHGYKGFFSIEMFNDELWAMSPAKASKKMYESMLPLCGR